MTVPVGPFRRAALWFQLWWEYAQARSCNRSLFRQSAPCSRRGYRLQAL